MKIDHSGINIDELAQVIEEHFAIGQIESISFIPKGEEGYAYLVRSKAGVSYFAKLLQASEQSDLCVAWKAIHSLYSHHHRKYIVAPLLTIQDEKSLTWGDKWLSLFPYLEAESLYDLADFSTNLEQIATIMADLHQVDVSYFSYLPQENFEHPFESSILKLLEVAQQQQMEAWSNDYQRQTSALFEQEREDILFTLEKMRVIQKQLSQLPIQQAVTHGDANFANIMRDTKDNLYLIDWGEIALGPVERDLMFFVEVDGQNLNFSRFMQTYLSHRPTTKMYPHIFQFYFYRWCLQEIADYGSRILLAAVGEEELRHSWQELQIYLPITHQDIAEQVDQISKCIPKANLYST